MKLFFSLLQHMVSIVFVSDVFVSYDPAFGEEFH